VRETVVPRRPFDGAHFTRRELALMDALATRFRDDYSQPMINITHEERGPWAAIWDNGRGAMERIPYTLAVRADDPHRDVVLGHAAEIEGIHAAAGAC
jgi:hypothetical protein